MMIFAHGAAIFLWSNASVHLAATRGEEVTAHASALREDTIRFERVYGASIEDVWALWTTKEGLEERFAPEGMHVEVSALELRVGGAFDHVMTAVGAEQVGYMAKVNRPLILTADRHPDPEMTRGATLGLTSQLQRFDLAIAARATREQRP